VFADAYGDKHAHDQADTYTEAAPYSGVAALAFVDENKRAAPLPNADL
jgi:hypothetical protein